MALSLPFTLTNGTLADANQVMANFNAIVSFVNSINLLDIPVAGSASNVKASVVVGTTVTVSADNVIVGTALNGTLFTLTGFSQSFNGSGTGAGGMDTGTLPTSSYVALYAIYNPAGPTVSILGTSAATSAPTIYAGANMPAGYTASALLCILPTNATPALQAGTVRNRSFQYNGVVTVLSGSTTNQASLTSLSIASAVPPSAISTSAEFVSFTTTGGVATTAFSVTFSSASSGGTYAFGGLTTAAVAATFFSDPGPLMLPTAQTIWYSTVGVGATISLSISICGYSW
jgi:hypothetical protein